MMTLRVWEMNKFSLFDIFAIILSIIAAVGMETMIFRLTGVTFGGFPLGLALLLWGAIFVGILFVVEMIGELIFGE